jgi:hypothetical protein
MKRPLSLLLAASLLCGPSTPGTACGPWFPRQFLAQGGTSLLETPEFFSEIELKLLAREFPTPFKALRDPKPQQRNAERDLEDFDAALAAGAIHPPDPAAARAAHRRMRGVVAQIPSLKPEDVKALPADFLDDARKNVFPSEFADYHEGALAYARGDHPAARAAWERLLARPAAERHYRSVNAAFMIGVLATVDHLDDADQWLDMTRDLVQQGFRDSSGLAAASYAWASSWHAERGELRAAAEDRLRTISTGYSLNEAFEPANDSPEELTKFSSDPLLRRVYTSLLLGRFAGGWSGESDAKRRLTAWLGALATADIHEFAGAERVAWLCYSQGEYAQAKLWLARAPQKSPESLWLAGKFAAREGRRADALRIFSEATRLLAKREEPVTEVTRFSPDTNRPKDAFAADRAIVALGAAEFKTALDSFLQGDHWIDAAFVAERLLTVEELRAYVAKRPWKPEWDALSPNELAALAHPPLGEAEYSDFTPPKTEAEEVRTNDLRWLLARRLTRLGRFAEARPFFPARYRLALDFYAHNLARGAEPKLAADSRALALWGAALEARYHGMELMGTETAPDWFIRGGDYTEDNPATYRLGQSAVADERDERRQKTLPLPAILEATPAERTRLQRSEPPSNWRWHYRHRAADLAWNAARLLPDNDPRLAEMLDLAGRWILEDEKADRFYQALERRCPATDVGRRATARRWFVDIENYTIPHAPIELPPEKEQPDLSEG